MYGADPCVKNLLGQGPVHIAAERGFDGILVFLCKELLVSPNVLDNDLRTPLHLACINSNESTSMFLIAWGNELNGKDVSGNTPLHFAANSQSYKITRGLLLQGADKTIKNSQGKTPFALSRDAQCGYISKILVRLI